MLRSHNKLSLQNKAKQNGSTNKLKYYCYPEASTVHVN